MKIEALENRVHGTRKKIEKVKCKLLQIFIMSNFHKMFTIANHSYPNC